MGNMNMIIRDMEGEIEIGDIFKNPKSWDKQGKLSTFARVGANPMWNQDWFAEADYDNSLSCYIHTSDAETCRSIAEFVVALTFIEAETNRADLADCAVALPA